MRQNFDYITYRIARVNCEPFQTFMFFGEDLSKIPCIRNSLLYAVAASCGTGILVNLATSRNTIGLSVGIFNVVLFGSW